MAKSIEQLQKEVDALQAKAMTAKKKLREAENAERKKAKIEERKNDTRRKILLGGFMLAKLKQQHPQAQNLYDEFLSSLTKKADREVFNLPPAEPQE